MIRLLQRLRRSRRGTSLIEFSIVLPVLLVMFLGGYELSDAMACKRRVTIMTRAMADLTSQYRTLSDAQITSILSASTQIMAPYKTANAAVRITHVTVDATGLLVRVNWSKGLNTGGFSEGWYYSSAIPLAFRKPNNSFIWAQSNYRYDAALDEYFPPVTFSRELWMLPRRSSSITNT